MLKKPLNLANFTRPVIRLFLALALVFGNFFFISSPVKAVAPCAVCVVAVSSGLVVSRALGIDDALVGIWVGALLLSIAGFTGSWIKKRWSNFSAPNLVAYAATYLLTIPFFFIFGLFGEVWYQSNLLFGMVIGTILLFIGLIIDKFLRSFRQDGKGFFPFQKVIVPVGLLSLGTLLTWFLT